MFTFIFKHLKYASAYECDGPVRAEAAEWFLRKMRSGRNRKATLNLWGMGSDMIWYKPDNVKDEPSKRRLNRTAIGMIEICRQLGVEPNVRVPPFDIDSE